MGQDRRQAGQAQHGHRYLMKTTNDLKSAIGQLRDGEPCEHPGCLSHVSHPCEGCGRIAGRTIRTMKTTNELKQQLIHAVTAYDRRQAKRQGHNPYALGICLERVDEIMTDIEHGADPRLAIIAGFSDRLRDHVLRSLDYPIATKEEIQAIRAWHYVPASAL